MSLNTAMAEITASQFTNNYALTKSKNIFLAFATISVTKCNFRAAFTSNALKRVQSDETLGSFFNIILDVKLVIDKCSFVNGISYSGGAIYVSGSSQITIKDSQFINNLARISGGAIYANGF